MLVFTSIGFHDELYNISVHHVILHITMCVTVNLRPR